MEHIAALLQERIAALVRVSEPLSHHTSFKIGGPASLFVEPGTIDELKVAVSLLRKEGIPFFILGNGTNLLVKDHGYNGVVVRLSGEFNSFTFNEDVVESGSAVLLSVLAREACQRGLSSLEFATGIPGTLGGAIYMNAGAHGRTIGDNLIDMTFLDSDSAIHTLTQDKLGLAYRKSAITEGSIICSARLRVCSGEKEAILKKCQSYVEFRQKRQPRQPSAGSVFKNPPGVAAGKLLDDAGLKGKKIGNAMISMVHANFIVNCGGATASDVLSLINLARDVVREKNGIELELEVTVLGD